MDNRYARRRSSAVTHAKKKRQTRQIVIMGSTKCGKTKLIKRFLDNSYTDDYLPTVEDCYNKDYDYMGFHLNLDVVDTCSPFIFPIMRDLNIKSASAIMLLYEIKDQVSIQELLATYTKIIELRKNTVPIVLVGTKMDLYDCQTVEEYEFNSGSFSIFNETNIRHVLTSAKNNIGVCNAFELGLDNVITKIHTLSMSAGLEESVSKTGCCSKKEVCRIC